MEIKIDPELVKIDEIDKEIINLLNEDGRMSYRKISRDLGISVGTVHNRVDKLMKTGVIKKFVPMIDHSRLGYKLTAIIGVRVKGRSFKELGKSNRLSQERSGGLRCHRRI